MPEPLSEEHLAALQRRYGVGTSGPNWSAADYADGPAKDALLDRAKEDVRDLLAEVDQLRAIVNDGGNQAALYWGMLQASRRENADLKTRVCEECGTGRNVSISLCEPCYLAEHWAQLQEARRENADLRAKGGHLADEHDALRAELADLHNVEADLRAQRDQTRAAMAHACDLIREHLATHEEKS